MSVISVLGRLRQDDYHKGKASLSYSEFPDSVDTVCNPVSNTKATEMAQWLRAPVDSVPNPNRAAPRDHYSSFQEILNPLLTSMHTRRACGTRIYIL